VVLYLEQNSPKIPISSQTPFSHCPVGELRRPRLQISFRIADSIREGINEKPLEARHPSSPVVIFVEVAAILIVNQQHPSALKFPSQHRNPLHGSSIILQFSGNVNDPISVSVRS